MKRVIAVLLLAISAFGDSGISLSNVKKIYIEKMDNNLDQYLMSEISKQFHGTVTVVLSESSAQAILKDAATGAEKTTNAKVELVDPNSKTVLWSGAASDRDTKLLDLKHGGEQKLAAHLVAQLKKAMHRK